MQVGVSDPNWIGVTFIVPPREAGLALAKPAFSLWMFALFRECATSPGKEFHQPLFESRSVGLQSFSYC
jgi:hypothetical protein